MQSSQNALTGIKVLMIKVVCQGLVHSRVKMDKYTHIHTNNTLMPFFDSTLGFCLYIVVFTEKITQFRITCEVGK